MNVAWRLGLLLALALAPVGCAHQSGARAPGGAPGSRRSAPSSRRATRRPSKRRLSPLRRILPRDDLSLEDEFDLLDTPIAPVSDPLAPWNRAMFEFNDKFYFWLLKPVSQGYRAVVPRLARTGVENFFNNLRAPMRFVSNVLQLKGREATIELGKFMINSTWGVLGFGNLFANNPETTIPDTDLGPDARPPRRRQRALRRLAVPRTLHAARHGRLGRRPGSRPAHLHQLLPPSRWAARSYYMVNYTSFRIGDYEAIKDASIDPYLATRDAYLQYRAEKAKE